MLTKQEGQQKILLTNNIKLLYTNGNITTYLHYNGTNTNPDHTLASTDIPDVTSRKL
jgi:hypothetical protein